MILNETTITAIENRIKLTYEQERGVSRKFFGSQSAIHNVKKNIRGNKGCVSVSNIIDPFIRNQPNHGSASYKTAIDIFNIVIEAIVPSDELDSIRTKLKIADNPIFYMKQLVNNITTEKQNQEAFALLTQKFNAIVKDVDAVTVNQRATAQEDICTFSDLSKAEVEHISKVISFHKGYVKLYLQHISEIQEIALPKLAGKLKKILCDKTSIELVNKIVDQLVHIDTLYNKIGNILEDQKKKDQEIKIYKRKFHINEHTLSTKPLIIEYKPTVTIIKADSNGKKLAI